MSFDESKGSGQFGDVFEQELFEFISIHCRDDLMLILEDARELTHFPILINYVQLNIECPMSTKELRKCPDKVLSSGDRAAYQALLNLYETCENKGLKLKRHVHLRIHCMPCEGYMTVFPGCEEVGTFMTIVGTVVKTSRTGLKEFKKDYKCSKCKHVMTLTAPMSRYHLLPKTVDQCENLCVGAKVEACEVGDDGSTSRESHRFKDYQEIKLQEQIKHNDFGTMPKAMWVVLEDDLVDTCKPGDDVIMSGALFLRFKPFRINQSLEADLAFKANHLEVKNDQRTSVLLNERIITSFDEFWQYYENSPFEGRNRILRSFCPQVYGMYLVKLAMCVVLAGGVSKEEGGSRVRGESHLLLVGDPGTGKSQLLKYASKLTPRSVFTTGAGTTSAGLTVAAIKENGVWHLEAGALVLADCGVCCIDEFSNIKEHDRVSIHEAMEQQTISIAKAGMVSKLDTKCTVIAATNPKFSKYDSTEDVELNVGLPSPLLSRFDLVIVLKDAFNEAWDELLCDFILGDADVFEMAAKNAMAEGTIWDTETLRSYIVLVKEKDPKMTEDAEQILSRYYHLQRNSTTRNVARTTVRLFESLFRLAEGHARLMYRDFVFVHDAIIAISLVEASMQSSALTESLPNPLHISFPKNALEEYYNQAKQILELLNLPELWRREEIYLDNLCLRQRQKKSNDSPPPPPSVASSSYRRPSQSHCNVINVNVVSENDPKLIPEPSVCVNNIKSTNETRIPTGCKSDGVPPNFFETDEDDTIPCSCRIVTSTQNLDINRQENISETEVFSPIETVPTRFLTTMNSPVSVNCPVGNFSPPADLTPCEVPKRKRLTPVGTEDEEDTENAIDQKASASEIETETNNTVKISDRGQTARTLLSRFRKETN